jgi:A/G-specific adenine glycosylase
VPRTVAELSALPGIGPYTAGAVASTAYDVSTPCVDGNVIRVIARLRRLAATPKDCTKLVWELCRQLVPSSEAGDFNQALMELGATICTPKSPACAACPVSSLCLAYQSAVTPAATSGVVCTLCADIEDIAARVVTAYPLPAVKAKQSQSVVAVAVVEVHEQANRSDAHFVIVQRPAHGLLAGLFEMPQVVLGEVAASSKRKRSNAINDDSGAGVASTLEARQQATTLHCQTL